MNVFVGRAFLPAAGLLTGPHPVRSAAIGSIRVALRAGT